MNGKKDNFLITLLSCLLLISCLLAGFFAWKTQKLVSELRVATNVLKPTPIATSTPTPDPTANWKTYTSTKYGFSFKYPNDFINKEISNNSFILSVGSKDYSLSLKTDLNLNIYTSEVKDIKRLFDTKKQNVNINGVGPYTAYLRSTQSAGGEFSFLRTILIPTSSYIIDLSLSPKDEDNFEKTETLADQILSTFKFTEPDTTCTPLPECAYNTDPKKPTCKIGEKPFEGGVWCPRPTETPIQTTACTMEAKICPDGSAVGRSGPKCEFTACPAPKY